MANIVSRSYIHKTLRCISFAAASALMVHASTAYAETKLCTATVSVVALTPDGTVVANFNGMGWPYLCNINTPTTTSIGTITPEACKGLFSLLITAKTSGQAFTIGIDYGAAAAPATCNNLANFNWGFPNPYPYWFAFGS